MAKHPKAVALPSAGDVVQGVREGRAVPPDFLDLIRHADAGDAVALERLREAYGALPALADHVSGLQRAAERAIVDGFGAGTAETLAAQAQQWRTRLAGDDPSPLERLLVNRVVLDWLHALRMDLLYQQKLNGTTSFAQGEFYAKQAERAQRRLLRSVTALARVRTLLGPMVQVNIAEQQVNVAGTVNAGASPTGRVAG